MNDISQYQYATVDSSHIFSSRPEQTTTKITMVLSRDDELKLVLAVKKHNGIEFLTVRSNWKPFWIALGEEHGDHFGSGCNDKRRIATKNKLQRLFWIEEKKDPATERMKVVDWGPTTHYIELLQDLKQTDDSIAGRKSRVHNPNKPAVANENVGDATAPAPQLSAPRRLPDTPVQPPPPLRMNGVLPRHPAPSSAPCRNLYLHAVARGNVPPSVLDKMACIAVRDEVATRTANGLLCFQREHSERMAQYQREHSERMAEFSQATATREAEFRACSQTSSNLVEGQLALLMSSQQSVEDESALGMERDNQEDGRQMLEPEPSQEAESNDEDRMSAQGYSQDAEDRDVDDKENESGQNDPTSFKHELPGSC